MLQGVKDITVDKRTAYLIDVDVEQILLGIASSKVSGTIGGT